jgi:cell division protein FtsW (lipid II flippase)
MAQLFSLGHMDTLGTFSFFVILAGITFVISSIACRRTASRGHRMSYWCCLKLSFWSAGLLMLALFGWMFFDPKFWSSDYLVLLLIQMVVILVFSICFCIVPALAVIFFHRRRLDKNHEHVAQ